MATESCHCNPQVEIRQNRVRPTCSPGYTLMMAKEISVAHLQAEPTVSVNASCVRGGDFNEDGKPDVFIGGRNVPGSYGVIPSSALLQNNGHGVFEDVTKTIAPDLQKLGMVTDAQWADIDGDGKNELIVVGDWMPVTILKFINGKFQKVGGISNSSGWWNCLTVADINGDGYPDLIAGNFGLNSRIKPDTLHPAKLYVGDFAKNGRTECVPVYYKTDGKAYPYFMKGEIEAEVPQLKKKFLKFKDYAAKTIEEVFSEEQLKQASVLTVTQPQSCIFINDGKGNFSMSPLPLRAQFSPVFGILAKDLNGDGITDLFLAGNFFGVKPQTGRFDASYGVTFLGDNAYHFKYLEPSQSGLFVRGEARDIATIKSINGESDIIVAVNNDNLYLFKKKKQEPKHH